MLVRFMQTDGKRVAVPVADVRVVTEIDERTTAVTRRNVHSGEGASYTSEIAEPFYKVFNAVNAALRAAFPAELAGIYTGDEMQQADAREARAAGGSALPNVPRKDEVDVAHMLEGSARELYARGVVEREKMETILEACREIKADIVTLGGNVADHAGVAQAAAKVANGHAGGASRYRDEAQIAATDAKGYRDESGTHAAQSKGWAAGAAGHCKNAGANTGMAKEHADRSVTAAKDAKEHADRAKKHDEGSCSAADRAQGHEVVARHHAETATTAANCIVAGARPAGVPSAGEQADALRKDGAA